MTVANLRLSVNSEWAPLRVALFHDADNLIDRVPDEAMAAKHPEQGSIRKDVFKRQHFRLRQLLENAGVTLILPQTQADAFCQVFTRDPCFVIGNTFFVSRMREHYRQLETAGLNEVHSRVTRYVILKHGVLEGGDVMVLRDNIVLVCC